jgi:uncharacterized repeat protein (TIGR03803 family)
MQKSLPMAALIGAFLAIGVPCSAAVPVLTTLYNFPGTTGAFPEASLVLNNGDLFGTTYSGGTGWGTVFALIPPQASGPWTIRQLYAFTGGADGANPRAGVIFSSHGLIYGTTEQGGAYGFGVVYSLTPAGGGKWTEAVLYSFTGTGGDGANPEAGMILSPKGLLYGTTSNGGSAGYGAVFSLTPSAGGGPWTEQVIYSFKGAPTGCSTTGNPACDGANPLSSLYLNANGALYGTTYSGTAVSGGPLWGTVFQLVQVGGVWTESVLYSFLGAPSGADGGSECGTTGQAACDGGAPAGGVVVNKTTGAIYGTTTLGGLPTGCAFGGYTQGCGTVFQLTPPVAPSTTWTESLLYTFGGPPNGSLPSYSLFYPPAGGPLYGTTFSGGSSPETCFPASYSGCGIAYVLQPPVAPSTTWTKSNMAVFNGDNGAGPSGLVLSPAGGVLYGTTYTGGLAGGYGTVFQIAF